jgi:hypothetical protein
MKDLIEALTIFAKYTSAEHPTSCEHDSLYVLVDPLDVSDADKTRLEDLGFHARVSDRHFESFRFGSA